MTDPEQWMAKARDLVLLTRMAELADWPEKAAGTIAAALAAAYEAGREDGEKAGVDAVVRRNNKMMIVDDHD